MTMRSTGLVRLATALATLMCLVSVLLPAPAHGGVVMFEPYPDDIVDDRASTNGCGSQGADGIDVPDEWFGASFTSSCDWHDQCYGTKGLSQSYCDRGMLDKTLDACDGNRACEGVALAYHVGVAVGGGDPYRDGQFAACTRDPHRNSRVHGDPHLSTFDGLAYDLMTAGEFTLIRDADGRDAVQARFFPTSDTFTVVSGIAVRLGDHEAVAQLDPATSRMSIYLDGEPVTDSIAAVEGGFIELGERLEGVNQVVTIRRDDGMRVEGVVYGNRIDIGINVFEPQFGTISGLLGDADGDAANDLVNADTGARLDTSDTLAPSFVEGVYESGFGDSWRVAPGDSMFLPGGDFDYHGEEARSWPREIVTLETFLGPEVEDARRQCGDAGLEGVELTACMFDLLASGDESYAETAARSSTRATAVASPEEVVSAVTTASGRRGDADVDVVETSPLVQAIITRDQEEVERLLEAGEPVDVASQDQGLTPLAAAAITGNVDIARLLLDAGADPNRLLPQGFQGPLSLAASSESLEMVNLLLDAGADPDGAVVPDPDADVLPPLAAATRSPEIMELLLAAGADPDGVGGGITPLVVAAGAGQLEAAELLLDAGARVDLDADPGQATTTALSTAVFLQQVEMVRLLVANGADPDRQISPGTAIRDVAFTEEMRAALDGQ